MAIFTAKDFTSVGARARRQSSGAIVPLARGLWTDEVEREPEDVVQENWMIIVGKMLPGAVISDRSGFTLRPVNGELFVSHPRGSKLVLPGMTIVPDGKEDNRRSDDVPLEPHGRLFGSSPVRALIDNAETRGRPGIVRRRLTREELHDEVVRLVTTYTPRQVQNMLEAVARDANKSAAESVRVFVDAANGKVNTLKTRSRSMNAAQRGEAYDHKRIALFQNVVADLQLFPPVQRFVTDPVRAELVPFYESYFSNYIEGSTLTIDEAERVIFDGVDAGKPEDAHDIRSTWDIVSDVVEMSRRPSDADEFLDALRDRHRVMMAAHPRASPGEWKTLRNQAGATVFVNPEHVVGTLRAGWEEGLQLTDPFQRAVYMMFVVTEVHPFSDGNGRSARVAVNAELIPAGMHRIVIPTVIRNDYMSALSRTTAGNGPHGLHRVLAHAQNWVARGEFPDLTAGDRYLRATNALVDSGVADREGLHLTLLRYGELDELGESPYLAGSDPKSDQTLLDIAVQAGERRERSDENDA